MNKRKLILIIVIIALTAVIYGIYSFYYILPTDKAKPQIQTFLDKNYNHKFKIINIEKDYCPDLFHQPWGYKLTLSDTNNIEFGNIRIEFNKYQNNWITYGGIDIEKEYLKKVRFNQEGLPNNYFQYFPTYEKEGKFIKDNNTIGKKHLEAIKQVLSYYKHKWKEVEGQIFYEGKIDDELLWNYTTKANDSIWLSTHN
ncbi:MAG: hypothetical protein U0V75_17855 [Ferruginibacter sp.]